MGLSYNLFKIKGVVQHYSWGGYNFIPQLLGIENKQEKPFAEYWIGAHPNHTSTLESKESLRDLIEQYPLEILGEKVAKRFASLPYLFKVLDVREMLSIQVHPNKSDAFNGFEEENKKNISLTAPNRNYKDQNHKPELMVALSNFYLLHGFKNKMDLKYILQQVPEFNFLLHIFETKSYKGLYEEVMWMKEERVTEILEPLIQRIVPLYKNNELQKDQEDFWAARAALSFCRENKYDRGIFSIYFLNLLHLKTGEGIFQPAGLPHAYLEGQNVEVMANSDNVLRAGLTDKHIDVKELMKHVRFESTIPNIFFRQPGKHIFFNPPVEEFELHQYKLEADEQMIVTKAAELWFVLEGCLDIAAGEEKINLAGGEALFITAGNKILIKTIQVTKFFRVSVSTE